MAKDLFGQQIEMLDTSDEAVFTTRRDKRASCGAVRPGAGRRRARGQHAQVDGE
ncbi:MAG: hypothetical protein ACLRI7_07490 [Ruthenibacterium lactatiformans]